MSATTSVNGLLVVIPARDEEELLGRCLAAVDLAVQNVRAARPGLAVEVVTVADRCEDRTADIAREAGVHVVEADAGCVGTARRLGVEAGVARLPDCPAHETWVSSTDADTHVPPEWLEQQIELATRGVRLVIGRAVPDQSDLDATAWTLWRRRHASTTVGAHVHGANLGFRLDDYQAAGGWSRLSEHEDRHLVDSLRAAGVPAAAGLDVLTSGRLDGRTPGGFSGYLRGIAANEPT